MDDLNTIDIADDRQLFLDGRIVDRTANVRFVMHRPQPREVAIPLDRPWEGTVSWCPVVVRDADRYRMWYRAQADERPPTSFTAYAESSDGISWQRPSLGLVEFNGSADNNICIGDGKLRNVAVFLDHKPGVPEGERYKAIARAAGVSPAAIFALVSADGVNWRPFQDEPIIVAPEEDNQFDSPFGAFWDTRTGTYVICSRGMHPDGQGTRIRGIRRTTSEDFSNWTPLEYISVDWGDTWQYHLYTNACHPYYRAPWYMMFPKRFLPDRRSDPEWPHEGLSDVLLIASREGSDFTWVSKEAFLLPGLDQQNWHERSIYIGANVVPTGDGEMSMYSVQNYRTSSVHIRRLSLREDGFVSAASDWVGGELVTRPILFKGDQLELNYSTSAAGSIQVAIQDAAGNEVPGHAIANCPEIVGDHIARTVVWQARSGIGDLAGQPVKFRFELKEADLFSFRTFTG